MRLALVVPQAWRFLLSCVLLVAMRSHLFVWSVFAPKFVYELVETLFVLVGTGAFSVAVALATKR